MGRKRGEYYINPEELKKDLEEYNDTSIISEELGIKLIKIARRYASRPNFSGYSYKEDFISDAILRMVSQIDKIKLNHAKCNPFSYLTQVCHNCYIAKINKEKKYTKTKEMLKDRFFDEIRSTENLNYKGNPEETDD